MGRARRVDVGGMIYHGLNGANFRSRLFKKAAHDEDFLGIVAESLLLLPMRLLAYCLMPNHGHLVLHPRGDGDRAKFIQRLTLTPTQRYHAKSRTVGYGHVYQGRYKSLRVESDRHFLTLVPYVERNAQRADWVKRAEEWPWSSVYVRRNGTEKQRKLLRAWPTPEAADYFKWLNQPPGREEVENIRDAIRRGRPYGSEKWVANRVAQFGLQTTVRNPWRFRKDSRHPFPLAGRVPC